MGIGLIALLFGAGLSAPFGVPTMGAFLDQFVALARRRYPQLTGTLDLMLQRAGSGADIEQLLSELGKAADVQDALPTEMSSSAITQYSTEARSLRAHLLSFVVETCEQFDRQKAVAVMAPLIEGLSKIEAVILTTNYDRVVEFVGEEQGIALSDGFERAPGLLVAPWNADLDSALTLAKLHGSVTWYRDPSGNAFRLDRGYPLPDAEFALSRAGEPLEPLMIVPTLEKMVLQEPYSHLFGFLQETLGRVRVLVVIGNSLRDAHLNGAIRYRADQIVVLVVGRTPEIGASRLGFASVVTLRADSDAFIRVCTSALLSFVGSLTPSQPLNELVAALRQWAIDQERRVAEWVGLTTEQHFELDKLAGEVSIPPFESLRILSGVRHPQVNAALRKLLSHESADVRSAVAGMLGLNQATEAIDELSQVARTDPQPSVRLEAALALQKIGSPEALAQLGLRATERADDAFVSGLLDKGGTDE